jgi:hypothetical protein
MAHNTHSRTLVWQLVGAFFPVVACLLAGVCCSPARGETVARQWNEALLDAIRLDFPAPTVHSRNLYHVSAAMYDAWAAYDAAAQGTFFTEKYTSNNPAADRNEAISYAAYRILSHRYANSSGSFLSQARFTVLLNDLGFDPSNTTTVGNSPAAVGNRIAQQILAATINDGSNETNGYVDNTSYASVNPPMFVDDAGVVPPASLPLQDPNHWQPLRLNDNATQNGLPINPLQTYVGPHWGSVETFALGRNGGPGPYSWSSIDPGPPPQLGGVGDQQYRDDTVELIRYSSQLDVSQGPGSELIDISPAVNGNRPLGTHNNQGYALNPVTQAPYAQNLVRRADYGRVLAEFWADGPESETPPGHWNVLANEVSDSPLLEKRLGGSGQVLDDLEWDVKLYLALNGGVHDAAIAAWGTKREYDYVRPITKIRYQGGLGQSTDANQPSYHPDGLPLINGLIELITPESIATNGKHHNVWENVNRDDFGNVIPDAHFTQEQLVGKVAVLSWNHPPVNPLTQDAGVDWILAENWVTYQSSNFVTPAFAAYVSGHSTFSRAAAQILAQFTGSEFFPGGLGEETFTTDFLDFEMGPSEEIKLQWATYFDAADEAGISRLWGGIHVPADDFSGRVMGDAIGRLAYAHALGFFGASVVPEPHTLWLTVCLALVAMARNRTRYTPTRRSRYFLARAYRKQRTARYRPPRQPRC